MAGRVGLLLDSRLRAGLQQRLTDGITRRLRLAFWTGSCPSPADPDLGGLRVFRVADMSGRPCTTRGPCNAWLVERSVNGKPGDHDEAFAYHYRATMTHAEEPEGLTFWDLDASGSPHVHSAHGQLHALVLANGLFDARDRVTIKHYRLEPRCSASLD